MKTIMHRATVLAVALGAVSSPPVGAQELITDRPDFTESAVVVPRGTTQIEAGVTKIDVAGVEALVGPELLVRWGLSERIELRFGLPDLIDVKGGDSGLSDGSVGAKWQIGPTAQGWDVGIIATVSVPLGDAEFTSDGFDPELIFTLGRDLASGWGLGTQLAAGRVSDGDDERTVLAATLVLGRGITPRLGTFVELAAEDTEGAETSLLAHHGYTLAVGGSLQFDVHFGVGLTDGAPDSLLGAGVSWRR